MIERQMESPIPIPRALVVNSGLKMRSMLDGAIPLPVSSIETRMLPCSVTSDFMDSKRRFAQSHGLDCIHHQIQDDLLQLDRVTDDGRSIFTELRLNLCFRRSM